MFGYHKDDGHEVVDEELHEYVVVNPCGASVSSAHNVSGKLYAYLECQGVDLGIVNKHIRSAEKAPACFEYTLKDDKKQSIIYVQSAAMFPSGRRHSVQAEDEYFDKLQAKYSEVFEKAYEGAVIRVPMIGFGAKKGQTEITSQLIKKNVGASQAAFEKFKTSLSVEFCIYDPEHYAVCHRQCLLACVDSVCCRCITISLKMAALVLLTMAKRTKRTKLEIMRLKMAAMVLSTTAKRKKKSP